MRAFLSRFLFRVVCVLWIESKRTKRKTKKIRERASERENTKPNQPSDAILYLFAKTSKFVPFLSRERFLLPLYLIL